MSKHLDLLFCEVAIASLLRQQYFVLLVGNCGWAFNVFTGTLSFSNLHWHAQILGTESHETNTWLWAWANTGSNLPPAVIQASLQMKQFGEGQNIRELTQPQLPLTTGINGHILSMIASGVCNADAYYRGPYDGGAVFLLIKDERFPRSTEHPLACITHVFPQAISSLSIADHRLALTSYLDQCGIPYSIEENMVVVKEGGATKLTATFDEQKRLTKLDARLGG